MPSLKSRTATRLPAPSAPFNKPTVAAATQRASQPSVQSPISPRAATPAKRALQPSVRSPISPRAATPAMGIRSPLERPRRDFAPIHRVLEEPTPGTPTPKPPCFHRRIITASEPCSRRDTPATPATPIDRGPAASRTTSRNASSTSLATTAVASPAALVATPHGFAWWSGRFVATCDRLATRAHRASLPAGGPSPDPSLDGGPSADGSAARRAQDPAARAELAFAELRACCRGHAARESLRVFRAEWYRMEEDRERRERERERGEEERKKAAGKAVLVKGEGGGQENVRRGSGFLGRVREFSHSKLPKLGGKK